LRVEETERAPRKMERRRTARLASRNKRWKDLVIREGRALGFLSNKEEDNEVRSLKEIMETRRIPTMTGERQQGQAEKTILLQAEDGR
jgi:hypothetical protein